MASASETFRWVKKRFGAREERCRQRSNANAASPAANASSSGGVALTSCISLSTSCGEEDDSRDGHPTRRPAGNRSPGPASECRLLTLEPPLEGVDLRSHL